MANNQAGWVYSMNEFCLQLDSIHFNTPSKARLGQAASGILLRKRTSRTCRVAAN